MLKFPTIQNVIIIEHVLEARQYPRCFLHLTERSHLREVGIIISADVEAETQATNTGGVGTGTQTCPSHNHSIATEFHLWLENKQT